MKTIHQIAQDEARYWDLPNRINESCPDWLRDKILHTSRRAHLRRVARAAIARDEEQRRNTLDYRGWHRDGRREGPGSGRSADWLDSGFRHLAVTAKTVHRLCGYRGDECRQIAHALHRLSGLDFEQRYDILSTLPPCTSEPRYFNRGYDEEFDRRLAASRYNSGDNLAGEHVTRWDLFYLWEIGRAVAESDWAERMKCIADDPRYQISGYLAASILAWKGEGGHDYTGCSGCGSYAIHREHPEEWDLLLSRAPVGKSTSTAEQVYPHETKRAEALRARGWIETLRLSDSIFTAT